MRNRTLLIIGKSIKYWHFKFELGKLKCKRRHEKCENKCHHFETPSKSYQLSTKKLFIYPEQ